ncbi:MAG: hypothetical protein U1E76_14790 [Planctomycetota bacterium]
MTPGPNKNTLPLAGPICASRLDVIEVPGQAFKEAAMRGILAAVSVFVVALTGCGGGGGGGGSSGRLPSYQTPASFAPSDPGFLVAGPAGLVLRVGDEVPLSCRLYDSEGNEQPPPIVSFESETPRVVRVSSDGVLQARSVGIGHITVTDDGRRSCGVLVDVVPDDEVPAGVTGIAFERPLASLMAGDRTQIKFSLTDATGMPVSGIFPSSRSGRRELASIDSAGNITALGEGLAVITASLIDENGEKRGLDGSVMVNVADPGRLNGPSADCDWQITGGGFNEPPSLFSRPGLKALLRATIVRNRICPSGNTFKYELSVRQEAPSAIQIEDPNVANLSGDGQLESTAPGFTWVKGYMQATDGGFQEFGEFFIRVFPNLDGVWCAKAKNEDHGHLSLKGWPSVVLTDPFLAPRLVPHWLRASGTAGFLDKDNRPVCRGDASAEFWAIAPPMGFPRGRPQSYVVSEDHTAEVVNGIDFCASGRYHHGGPPDPFSAPLWEVLGPDHFRLNGDQSVVDFERSTKDSDCPEDFATFEIDGYDKNPIQDPMPAVWLDGSELDCNFYETLDGEGWYLNITVNGFSGPGTYVIGNIDSGSGWLSFDDDFPFETDAKHLVTITITDFDGSVVSGTFAGTLFGDGTKHVSNGSFSATLIP